MKKYFEQKVELIIISLVLVASIVALSLLNSSTAWFANNERVDANSLSLTAKTTANLIIADDLADISEGVLNFNVNFKDFSRQNMIAVTRDPSINTADPYLVYITNHYAVNPTTGLTESANDKNASTKPVDPNPLGLTPVPEEDNEAYFIDKVIYLASTVESISVKALTASITVPDQKYLDELYINAASIDFYFYVCDRTKDECKNCTAEECKNKSWQWCETTSVADSVNGTDKKTINILTNTSVPHNTDGYVAVLMRFYFDGALTYSTKPDPNSDPIEKAYITSATVKTDNAVNIGVQFSAVE